MRPRIALIALVCAVSLLVGGCSTTAGTAVMAGGGAPAVPNAQGSGGNGDSSDLGGGSGSSGAGSDAGDSGQPGATGLPGTTGLPAPTDPDSLPTDLGSLPTDLGSLPTDLGSLPTNLGSIPGVSDDCMSLLGILMGVSSLFLGPTLGGQPITKEQVDQAFNGMGVIPDELKAPLDVIHQAAEQAVGKSSTEALQILGSDKVSAAMNQLTDYSDSKCGGS